MTKKILLVEDNVTLSEMYADVLRDEGYEVITADDGVKATELIKNLNWDLLLLDIMLPKIDGISILREIVSSKDFNLKPVIIMSNVSEPTLVKQCMDLGVKEFLIKANIGLDQLLEKISRYLNQNDPD